MPEIDLSSVHDLIDLLILGAGIGGGVLAKVFYDRRKAATVERHVEHNEDQAEIQSLWVENRKLREELSRLRERLAVLESKQAEAEIAKRTAIATIKTRCPLWREHPCPRLLELGDPEAIAIAANKLKERKE